MYLLRRWKSITSILYKPARIICEKRGFAKAVDLQPKNKLLEIVNADTEYQISQNDLILRIFPNVKETVNNLFNNLSTNLDSAYRCQDETIAVGKVKGKIVFMSTFTCNWPKHMMFIGYGFSKGDAKLNALIKALQYLYDEKLITLNGNPVTISNKDKQSLLYEWNRPPEITLSSHIIEEGWEVLNEFKENAQPYLEGKEREMATFLSSSYEEDYEDDEIPEMASYNDFRDDSDVEELRSSRSVFDMITGEKYEINPESSRIRSSELLERLSWRTESPAMQSRLGQPLPMLEYKDILENALDTYQVVIVSGDTGCGKSTQVPQMILDKWTKEGRGAECNILISQPRRISAISLAKRVSYERGEKLGESVGYHVRLDCRRVMDRGGMMFLTTGMLLQGLHSNPTLEGITHVILDEVHERSVQIDLLLILLRRLIHSNRNLKLILMSASLSTQEIQNYFGMQNCSVIKVPGTLFPITRHYLSDVLDELDLLPYKYQLEKLREYGLHPIIDFDLVLDVIKAIDSSRPPGSILCFLPGWQDINSVLLQLEKDSESENKLWVLPLHSRVPSSEQENIFKPAPIGRRKVVLATNLAETSLTIQDVVYVIDTGCHKEQRYDSRKDLSVLGKHWISKANGQQRAGRAGRVQPGEVFHLYSDEVRENMSEYPVPEILRIPLEHVVLQSKSHCEEESASSFLSEGLSVPSPKLITKAVENLEKLGMLTQKQFESVETLTPLGLRVVNFSTPPYLSKALIYASIFKCIDSVSSIAAVLSSGRSIFFNELEKRSDNRNIKMVVNPYSDLLAILGLIQQWETLLNCKDAINFCNSKDLSHQGLTFNKGIKRVYENHLRDALMVDDNLNLQQSRWNLNNHNSQLVLGVFLAGVDRIFHLQRGIFRKGILRDKTCIKTMEGRDIETSSDSVLHKIANDLDDNCCHLLCVNLARDDASRRTFARDLSVLEPLTVSLFAGNTLTLQPLITIQPTEKEYLLTVEGHNISFHVDQRTGNFLIELRNAVNLLVEIIVINRGLEETSLNIEAFCDKLVQYISRLIMERKNRDTNIKNILADEDDW